MTVNAFVFDFGVGEGWYIYGIFDGSVWKIWSSPRHWYQPSRWQYWLFLVGGASDVTPALFTAAEAADTFFLPVTVAAGLGRLGAAGFAVDFFVGGRAWNRKYFVWNEFHRKTKV